MLSQIARARVVAAFATGRISDYAELLKLELVEYRRSVVLGMVGWIALVVCGLACAGFISVAVIVSYWDSAYRVQAAWGIAALWGVLALASWGLARAANRDRPVFSTLSEELNLDLAAIRGAGAGDKGDRHDH
ncbi:hypothetical protein ANDA3_0885 [plant metagenome]|uniref:Transmembrane protein n=2 Tax=root TaxID=1 RepID=A0A1C3K1C9_9BURK|nr:hypothetical protein [Orrella dioscoreae]SBT25187.1 hypothetical protein ODI_00286 [Orrella dioscoreae]SOE47507.1 hypothetical protein ODI_R0879 [Orrella dioscoreae]